MSSRRSTIWLVVPSYVLVVGFVHWALLGLISVDVGHKSGVLMTYYPRIVTSSVIPDKLKIVVVWFPLSILALTLIAAVDRRNVAIVYGNCCVFLFTIACVIYILHPLGSITDIIKYYPITSISVVPVILCSLFTLGASGVIRRSLASNS